MVEGDPGGPRLTPEMISRLRLHLEWMESYLLGRLDHAEFSLRYFKFAQAERFFFGGAIGEALVRLMGTAEAYEPDLEIRSGMLVAADERELLQECRDAYVVVTGALNGA